LVDDDTTGDVQRGQLWVSRDSDGSINVQELGERDTGKTIIVQKVNVSDGTGDQVKVDVVSSSSVGGTVSTEKNVGSGSE